MSPILSILFLAAASSQQPPAQAVISQVVVYPDRAHVTRVAQVSCGAGVVLPFAAIPPAADPASFRARTNIGTIEGLRAEERTRADAYGAEVKVLGDRMRALEAELAALGDALGRGKEAARIAGQYADVAVGQVGGEMVEAAPGAKAWGTAFEAVLAARLKASAEAVELGAKVRERTERLAELQRQRARTGAAAQRKEYLAEVLVSCPRGGTAQVELTYLVGAAAWEPAYEARADAAREAVELATYATVRQSTGESWARARLVLSTAVPRQEATPPEIGPLRVWAEEREPPRKVLVRRDELQEHAEAAGPAGQDAKGEKTGKRGELRAAAQGLSVQLVVPEVSDVAGDGIPVRLLVARTRLEARFALRAMPKMMPFVFRVADLVNRAPFPLLAGPLDAFGAGGLAGRYMLPRVAEGEPFHVTFGIEEGVRVKRTVLEELVRDAGFFGTRRRFRYAYRYEVASYLGRDDTVELSDHLPVSELDDVKVELVTQPQKDRYHTGAGHELRPADGIVRWRLPLRPGEKRVVDLAFQVDVPSSYDSGAL